MLKKIILAIGISLIFGVIVGNTYKVKKFYVSYPGHNILEVNEKMSKDINYRDYRIVESSYNLELGLETFTLSLGLLLTAISLFPSKK
jgi:hypothetical protein